MKYFEFSKQKTILGRLNRGDDILLKLTEFCKEQKIQVGHFQAIGAVEKGVVGFYDQATASYKNIEFNQEMEIGSLVGNISIKDGDVFLHGHLALADDQGKCFAGHLMEGNIVFACEFVITALEGEPPVRKPDEQTKLILW
jgi:predicted DNA-binding protein with PD1-like motif